MSAPSPAVLWYQADKEHPNDDTARIVRYHELMVEHGHLIAGKQKPLPCGWPFLSDEDEKELNDGLATMARNRRRAGVESRKIEMP